jgi:hypothetical protein
MKLLMAVLATTICLAADDLAQITHLHTENDHGSPAVLVQFYTPSSVSSAYRIYIEYETESGRLMKSSRLIDYQSDSKTGVALLSAMFETGVCKVKLIRVASLAESGKVEKAF